MRKWKVTFGPKREDGKSITVSGVEGANVMEAALNAVHEHAWIGRPLAYITHIEELGD